MYVQCTAEDEGKSQNVVDLVRKIRTAGCHDDVVTHRASFIVGNFGIRVRHGKYHRARRQGDNHLGRERAFLGEAQQYVRTLGCVGQRPHRSVFREALLIRIHTFFAAFVDDALGVDQGNVFALHAHAYIVLSAGDARGSSPVDDNLDLVQALTRQFDGVGQRCTRDNRGTVLVIVENGNVHRLLESFLDVEALGRLDVFQVDAAEGGFE